MSFETDVIVSPQKQLYHIEFKCLSYIRCCVSSYQKYRKFPYIMVLRLQITSILNLNRRTAKAQNLDTNATAVS